MKWKNSKSSMEKTVRKLIKAKWVKNERFWVWVKKNGLSSFYVKYILRQKFSAKRAPGGHRNVTVNFFSILSPEELKLRSKILWSFICVILLQRPRKSPDLDSFSDFLEKLETSFCTIFWYFVQHVEMIFPVLSRRVTSIFLLDTPKKT